MLQLTERLNGHHHAADTLLLPFDERKRGRLKAVTKKGVDVGIFIERGEVLRHGTCLKAESGEIIEIQAASEQVTVARCRDPYLFSRACYHLGNRHVPLQIGEPKAGEHWLRFQCDHVLDEMLVLLGLDVDHESAPFEPENGAYAPGTGHAHGHSHSYSHSHSHGHHHEH
ncbi:urease accessory protein UreE [Parendozoicomonas sp. Alg238-R29]|uniref:urease accessory protein UreE n=1 Tax=Parendozoicomonas sp. Alg238-R29 TaxID=2993446 RepID=UPI00248E091A|nr:urease accessory protein UreE [Parendozoicomonas sp. Alg238-R29]